jgi:hypothetical protein
MHTEYLQSLRYKLQKRIRRQKATGFDTYIFVLRQLWGFLDAEPAFVAIQAELHQRWPTADSIAETIVKEGLQAADQKDLLVGPLADEHEWTAVSLGVLRRFARLDDYQTIKRFVLDQSSTKYDDYFSAFSQFYLDPFYEYIDERLDDPQFVLGQLIRFKHLCEWFWRDTLYKAWESAKLGEKVLAMRLYEFLFTEGIHIHIEPLSASGEADMVSSQEGNDRLIADAKVFNPNKRKDAKYIIQGFRQVYQYTTDYNAAIGYLLIFNTSDKQLRLVVSGSADPLPRVVLNHKTICFLVIDLYPHETSASKRPQAEIAEITEAEILGAIKEAPASAAPN